MTSFQSEQVNEIYKALAKAQGEIRPALKDTKNPFFKSKYADLSSVWECCREPLSKNGLCVSQSIMVQDGANVLLTILGHNSGQWIKSIAPIIVGKPDAQAFGSAVTYQRRYALSAIVGVSTEEDDDGESSMDRNKRPNNVFKEPEPLPSPVRIDAKQVKIIKDLLSNISENARKNMMTWLGTKGFGSIEEVSFQFFPLLKNRLELSIEASKKSIEEESANPEFVKDPELPF